MAKQKIKPKKIEKNELDDDAKRWQQMVWSYHLFHCSKIRKIVGEYFDTLIRDDEQKLKWKAKLKGKSSAQQYLLNLRHNTAQKQQDKEAKAKARKKLATATRAASVAQQKIKPRIKAVIIVGALAVCDLVQVAAEATAAMVQWRKEARAREQKEPVQESKWNQEPWECKRRSSTQISRCYSKTQQ